MNRRLLCRVRPVLLGTAAMLGCLLTAGCGGRALNARPLLADVQRFESESQRYPADSTAAAILLSAQLRRDDALLALADENHKAARPMLELALGDARTAHAMVFAALARQEADSCLMNAEAGRRRLEEALHRLRETEEVAGPAPWAVPEDLPDMGSATARALPGRTLATFEPPRGAAAELSTIWMGWRDAALANDVPYADLENRFTGHLAEASADKASKEARARALYLAGRALQELEARIVRETSLRTCARSAAALGRMADARDDALYATLRLERGLQGALRTQLEDARVQAESRQTQLFDALHQLEGEYARITQEARGTIVSLADILFDFDRATLHREAEFNLVRVATVLNQFPEMQVLIEGHTDNVGTAEYNLELSRRRARTVHDFLVSQGVAPARLTWEGYGLSRPVADNAAAAGRQRNRRVDLVIQGGTN